MKSNINKQENQKDLPEWARLLPNHKVASLVVGVLETTHGQTVYPYLKGVTDQIAYLVKRCHH